MGTKHPKRLPAGQVEANVLASNTNTPTPTLKSEFAILESNTPVECSQFRHQDNYNANKTLRKLPSALPVPKIIGPVVRSPPETQAKRSSFVAMLGGSGQLKKGQLPVWEFQSWWPKRQTVKFHAKQFSAEHEFPPVDHVATKPAAEQIGIVRAQRPTVDDFALQSPKPGFWH